MIKIFFDLIKKYRRNFTLYFLVGGFCALIDWLAFYLLVYKFAVHYMLAGFIAFIVSVVVNFFLSKLIFKSRGFRSHTVFILILLASTFALCIDLGTMFVLVYFFGIPQMAGKILGTGVAFMFNFTARQFFIFSRETTIKQIKEEI